MDYDDDTTRGSRRGVYLASGLIVVALIIIGLGLFFYFHSSSGHKVPTKTNKPNISSQSQTGNSSSAKPNNQPSSSKNSSSGSTPKSSQPATGSSEPPSGSAGTNGKTTSPTKQLANTGPGNVIALFVGASLVSALGYEIHSRRHTNTKQ